MNIDLSYINDLKERYIFALINKKLMDDYKQYTSSFDQGYITMKNTAIPYILDNLYTRNRYFPKN